MATHVMLDIEALSDELPVQVGMVTFDTSYFLPINDFSVTIDPLSCKGRPSVSTVLWWFRQSQGARDASFGEDVAKLPIKNALQEVNNFYRNHGCTGMWSHSYDKEVLSKAFAEVGLAPAWGRKDGLDFRTACKLRPEVTARAYKTAEDGLIPHIAVNDAIKQLRVLKAIFDELGLDLF